MKFTKTGLLTMLVSLFILGACENPSGVGLDVESDIALNSSLIDTSTVITKLMKVDSTMVNYTSTSSLAFFKDPTFGTTTSSIAAALLIPTTGLNFGLNPVLDSAVLVLPFVNFYGDSLNTTYVAEVRQLNEVLYKNSPAPVYFNSKTWDVNNTIIGSKTFTARYRDSIILQDIIVGKRDSTKKVPAQLRIRLNQSLITNLILNADSLNLANNQVFNTLIKGLYISLNKTATTNNGGVFTFATGNSNASKLDIFYKRTNATGGIDTLNASLNIDGQNGYAVNEVSWDLSGTPVQTELQTTSLNSNNLYFKGFNGTQVKVDFPYIERLRSLGTNISINRAELVLKVVNGSETPYKPLPNLRIFRWDIAERNQIIPDENTADPRSLGRNYGIYDSRSKSYVFNITAYVQDLINGRTKNFGTFITSTDVFSDSKIITPILNGYGRGFDQTGRSVIGSGNSTSFKTQLKIYYTDLK